ncbi:MAG: phage major tail protein, TP901-1 family [Parvibaculum sp.]|nr:phage major tail protein, TP901-1 family [Parvibaculum sp.]|tara:strand:- start:13585 stop:13998 length:414 start_codon:yes stop_codon:yes gene_type:complete
MAAQKGKDLLIKLDAAGTDTFVTVAGLRARSIAFNARSVDVTNAESSGQWRELLAGAGVRTASVSGRGIFKDSTSDANVRTVFFDAAIRNWQIVIPDFGTVAGAFQITALEYGGEHDGEVTFDMALESAGALVFTAA